MRKARTDEKLLTQKLSNSGALEAAQRPQDSVGPAATIVIGTTRHSENTAARTSLVALSSIATDATTVRARRAALVDWQAGVVARLGPTNRSSIERADVRGSCIRRAASRTKREATRSSPCCGIRLTSHPSAALGSLVARFFRAMARLAVSASADARTAIRSSLALSVVGGTCLANLAVTRKSKAAPAIARARFGLAAARSAQLTDATTVLSAASTNGV